MVNARASPAVFGRRRGCGQRSRNWFVLSTDIVSARRTRNLNFVITIPVPFVYRLRPPPSVRRHYCLLWMYSQFSDVLTSKMDFLDHINEKNKNFSSIISRLISASDLISIWSVETIFELFIISYSSLSYINLEHILYTHVCCTPFSIIALLFNCLSDTVCSYLNN